MPSVQRVYEALPDNEATVLAISIDGRGMQDVQPFMTTHGYTIPTVVDTSMAVARRFGVRTVPTTYIVNRRGEIIASGFGPVDFDDPAFTTYLEALLAQPRG